MRPAVDVVVPFRGDDAALAAAAAALARLTLGPDDTLRIADNRRAARAARAGRAGPAEIVAAGGPPSSYSARNRAAGAGNRPWILFLDADVLPVPDLLERYFDPPPGERAAVLAGGIDDQPAAPGAPAALRYAALRGAMAQERSLEHGERAFAKTANCLVRREAFAAAGGFAEGIRSGGDADLCWRLAAAGWALEPRPSARVTHRNRATVPAMLGQLARHGAGAAWLGRRHPGALPRRSLPGLVRWTGRRWRTALAARRAGEPDAALVAALDPAAAWAFELGRLLPNRTA